jgi:PIN domain nuclease of toxin-antitoxin system
MGEGPQRRVIRRFSLQVEAFSANQAYAVAQMRAPTRQAGLSLGDRACLALARELRCPALTADRQWAAIDVGVEIRLIR